MIISSLNPKNILQLSQLRPAKIQAKINLLNDILGVQGQTVQKAEH